MKKLQHVMLGMSLLLAFTSCATPIKNAKTETYKVAGNCEMCKNTIETAANKKGVSIAEWDKDKKTMSLTYDSQKTNASEILKKIAYAGYDNEQFLAPDEAYAKLDKCCQYDRVKKGIGVSPNTGSVNHHEESANQDANQTEEHPLKEVYSEYFALKDALVKDDGTLASTKSKSLLDALSKVDMTKLSTEEHTVWMKNLSALKLDAEHIAETKEVSHQRDHFASLSTTMYAVMKVIKPEETVYYQHCPMYNDGKGADWLSKESVVKNPYYGSSMLSCGKTTQTIK